MLLVGVPLMASAAASRQAEHIVLQALTDAANVGAPCPTNEGLCDLLEAALGFTALSGPPGIIARLERVGTIRVQRYQRERQVTIVDTGKSTAPPRTPAPHWRDRPAHVPSPSTLAVQERRPDLAREIYATASRLGRSPADFLADLVWLGWEAMQRAPIHSEPVRGQH